MVNPFKEVNWNPSGNEIRKFGITMLIGFSVLALISFSYNKVQSSQTIFPIALIGAGFFLFVISFTLPSIGKYFYFLIYILSCCAGIIIGNLVMVLFYYAFFTPIALIVRVTTGRDPLRLKKPVNKTNWNKYDTNVDLKRYYKQY